MQDFSGGGPNFNFFVILDIHAAKRHVASSFLRAFARRVWGHAPYKKILKNGANSCVLRAIFNHFHGKKSSQKIINKHEFFHRPFYNAALPLIYLNIDVMDT